MYRDGRGNIRSKWQHGIVCQNTVLLMPSVLRRRRNSDVLHSEDVFTHPAPPTPHHQYVVSGFIIICFSLLISVQQLQELCLVRSSCLQTGFRYSLLQNNILFAALSASYHGLLASSTGVILILEICAFDVAVVLAGMSLAN